MNLPESQNAARTTRTLLPILVLDILSVATSCSRNLDPVSVPEPQKAASGKALGVCPPFPLRDEAGNVINPVKGKNDTMPYSPRQTCGASGCHDYAKITEGFHFTQGKGEAPPEEFAARYNWVTSPGNYGGNWCSPSPLYRQLAPKKNPSARTIDMTSFDFVTATCGNCHPGGGPLEFDREGKWRDLPHKEYEATAYASAYKFSHDIAPARAALGAAGCTECHRSDSAFFRGAVLDAAFTSNDTQPRWIPNHTLLGVSPFWVRLGAIREQWLKPLVYGFGTIAILLLASLGIGRLLRVRLRLSSRATNLATAFISLFGILALGSLTTTPDWLSYILVRRFALDANHALISLWAFCLAAGITFVPTNIRGRFRYVLRMTTALTWTGLALASFSAVFMFLKIAALPTITRFSYTGLEVGLVIALFAGVLGLGLHVISGPSPNALTGSSQVRKSIIGGGQ
jgi:hypothetical protein